MKAVWNNRVIAESDDTVVIENNHYFPVSSVNMAFLKASETTSNCYWKGTANYYSIEVDGESNTDSAWYYPEPMEEALAVKNHIAFWKGVEIKDN